MAAAMAKRFMGRFIGRFIRCLRQFAGPMPVGHGARKFCGIVIWTKRAFSGMKTRPIYTRIGIST